MENNTKKKFRFKFNLIDFLIIVAIIAIIGVIAFRSGIVDDFTNTAKGKTIEYQIKIGDVQAESYDYINVGDKIYSEETDAYLGTVTAKYSEPTRVYIVTAEGDIVKTEQPGRADIYLTLEAKGTVDAEGGCKVDGKFFVAAGKYFACYTDSLYFNVEVRDAYEKAE